MKYKSIFPRFKIALFLPKKQKKPKTMADIIFNQLQFKRDLKNTYLKVQSCKL